MELPWAATATRFEETGQRFLDHSIEFYVKHAVVLGGTLFATYVLLVLATAFIKPVTDWDILAYIAVAAEHNFASPAALHAHTYQTLKDHVSDADFLRLTSDGEYRRVMSSDPAAFVSMLGMYRVKYLYCQLLAALSALMSPIWAVRTISAVSAAAFGAISFAWLKHNRALSLAPIFAGILIVTGFADMARAVSPDMVFAATVLVGLYAHVRRQELLSALLLFAAFLLRPDNIIFLGLFAVLLAIFRQWSWGVFAAFAAAAIVFIPLTLYTGAPGWWPHLVFTSSSDLPVTLDGYHPPFSILIYVKAFLKQFLKALTSEPWIGVLLLMLAGWYVVDRPNQPLSRQSRILMLALVLGIAAKFIVLPVYETRIFFPFLVAPFLVFSSSLVAIWPVAGERLDDEMPLT